AITDDMCFHQSQATVDIKRAMFEASARRLLLVDHTKFEKRALPALMPLSRFDAVVVDSRTRRDEVSRLEARNIHVVVARNYQRSDAAKHA
ncbi:DeoR/GlpR transcriptional regulator, partial [Arthrobacter deserti]|nr:DeoR/GlpR transcriptional regulator [Arthrobacter deserti]